CRRGRRSGVHGSAFRAPPGFALHSRRRSSGSPRYNKTGARLKGLSAGGARMITDRVVGCLRTSAALALLALAACRPAAEAPESDAAREASAPVAAEHAGETGDPSPAAGIPPERAVVAETLAYAEVEDQLYYGHFVFPSDMV